MSRIIGCNSLHIAELTKDDSAGVTWKAPEAVPSVISVEISDNTENVTFYSDDVTEQVIPSFAGKEVTITLGYLSNELEAKISGNSYANGVLVQKSGVTAPEFALLFRAPLSKGGYQYVCLYKGVLTKNDSNYQSKEESIEGQTVTLTGVFMPLQNNGEVAIKANSTDEGAQTLIGKWFTEVPVSQPSLIEAKKK